MPGGVVGILETERPQVLEIGGLETGLFEVEAARGPHRARGRVQIGPPGAPPSVLNLELR